MALLGLCAIGLLIWFVGPLIAVADYRPLESEKVRTFLIGLVVVLYIAKVLWKLFKTRRANANLMEHALMFAALAPRYDIRLLILPVFLDDIREQGIRPQIAELQEEPRVRKHVEQSAIWPHIAPLLARNGDTEAKEPAGFQQTFEAGFNARLEKVWPLWRNRANLRGLFGILTHTLRNKVLGINAQSKRKVDPNVYREKMATLAAALTHARDLKIKVLLYVPPFRQDIQGPYVDSDYAMLKADLQVLAANYGAHFANLESIVPGPEWGNVVDSIFGFQDYDFMHFTGEGHRRHAQALDAVLRKMGF